MTFAKWHLQSDNYKVIVVNLNLLKQLVPVKQVVIWVPEFNRVRDDLLEDVVQFAVAHPRISGYIEKFQFVPIFNQTFVDSDQRVIFQVKLRKSDKHVNKKQKKIEKKQKKIGKKTKHTDNLTYFL